MSTTINNNWIYKRPAQHKAEALEVIRKFKENQLKKKSNV